MTVLLNDKWKLNSALEHQCLISTEPGVTAIVVYNKRRVDTWRLFDNNKVWTDISHMFVEELNPSEDELTLFELETGIEEYLIRELIKYIKEKEDVD